MNIDITKYWTDGHKRCLTLDWIDKPTIFVKQVIKYFPKKAILLDLGAGQGQDSRYFAKKGYEVTCTDLTPIALKLAKEKAVRENLEIKFKVVDISKKLPFRSEQFDVVYSHLALHYFDVEDTKKIFLEIHRVLKPGGILAALLNSQSDPEVKEFKKVGENLYFNPKGLVKSYYTAKFLKPMIKDLFDPIIIDDKGQTYNKDKIKTLVRFVGKKI